MKDFILREISYSDIELELSNIGFDSSYKKYAKNKYEYINIKIYSLTPAQANIIKQTALSTGADCATHRDVITGRVDSSNCIIGGSVSEICKISEKLLCQPFGLNQLGIQLKSFVVDKSFKVPKIVGILNLTENSFSGDGVGDDIDKAIMKINQLIEDGAHIIDIGAESTKPYSKPISDKEQLKRLLSIINYAKDKITLSIDTRSAVVADECIEAGANIINDVSGFDYDSGMIDVIAKHNCPVVIQHSKGTPENMQDCPFYNDVIEEIFIFLKQKCDLASSKGIENIIVDPGIGFGKSRENNFEIIRRIKEFKSLGYPVMLGISRKSFLNLDNNEEKDVYTTVFNALATERNVDFLRVHNVKMHKTLIDLMKMFMIK